MARASRIAIFCKFDSFDHETEEEYFQMCDVCGAIICALFDRMIEQELARMIGDIGTHRNIHPTNVAKQTGANDSNLFAEFVDNAAELDLSPQELEQELVKRTKFSDQVSNWIHGRKIPNGLVRKIILTNVEQILKEHDAQPVRSARELKFAA